MEDYQYNTMQLTNLQPQPLTDSLPTPRVISGAGRVAEGEQEPLLVRRPYKPTAVALPPVLLRGGRGQVRDDGPI